MVERRTYRDSCGIARGLDAVGDRWAMLVARELLLGPKRFTDLREGLPGVGPDILAQRLRDLEQAGVVRRETLPPPARAHVYALTAWGAELGPVLLALGRWGSRVPLGPDPAPLSPDALAIALETVYDPAGAGDGPVRCYQLHLGEHAFAVRVQGPEIDVVRGSIARPLVTLTTDPGTLMGLLWHGRPMGEAIRSGKLAIGGPRREAERFLKMFAAPKPREG